MERRISGVNEKKNTIFFDGGGEPSPAVLDEESALLFSSLPRSSSDAGRPNVSGDSQSAPLPDTRTDTTSELPVVIRREPASSPNAADNSLPPSGQSAQPQKGQALIERLRDELAIRRREDSVYPSTRRPRLEKKAGRVFPQTASVHSQAPKTAPVQAKRAAPSWNSRISEGKPSFVGAKPRRSFAETLYSLPLLGYCAELLVQLVRLPVVLREVNIRQTRKDTVVQSRLDGIGNRVAALREGASLCRREMEAALSGKADADTVASISEDLSKKVDAERFDSFTLNLEAELSRKVSAESLEDLGASWETALSELREELSGKAGKDSLRAMENELQTKANAGSTAAIEEKVERIIERLGALDGSAVLDRLESMELLLEGKADIEEVAKLLSAKLDTDALEIWGKRLEDASAQLLEALSQKADVERVDALSESLRSKADGETLESLSAAKADVEELLSLKARFESLGAHTSELENSLHSLCASKADLDAVRSLGERFEGVAAQLGALEGESVLKRLSSAESAIERKADLEIVKSLLSLKMDVEVLKSLGKSLEEASGQTFAALEKKADLHSVESVASTLDLKADAESVRSLNEGLSVVNERLGGFASKEDFSKVEELERLLSRKADADALEERLSALDAKADLKTVEEKLAQKADAEAVESLSKEFEQRLAVKADAAAVDEALAKKAGKDALDEVQKSVGSELSVLHARIDEGREQASEEERRLVRFREEVKALIASSLERGARGQIEEAFRATFPYVQKMKGRFPAFQGIDTQIKKTTQRSGGQGTEDAQSRKRVKR